MNKTDIIDYISSKLGITKAEVERMLDAYLEFIVSALKRNEEVSHAGLGIWVAKTRPGRTGRNPRTGATIQIQAMRVPKFRASKTLKDVIK